MWLLQTFHTRLHIACIIFNQLIHHWILFLLVFCHLKISNSYELYYYSNEILKCCIIYHQPFSQIPSQKTVLYGNRLWTHYPFLPIICLSKAKYNAHGHQTPWHFFCLSVKHREVYHKVYLKPFQNHMRSPFLASYLNWLLKTFAVQSTYQGFIQAFLLTSVFYGGLSFVGSRGKAPGSFGYFANSKFSNSLSIHNLISFFRSLFLFIQTFYTFDDS